MDIVDPKTRSRMMSAIRDKNTNPELAVRRYLHAQGFRYRLHRRDLPGNPDLVLPKYRLAIFVHGCFWHRHSGCFYATTPSSRSAFWEEKFQKNVERDERNNQALLKSGWRVMVIWECGLKCCVDEIQSVCDIIRSSDLFHEWPEFPPRVR
ncbi:very short patch repair endonuclease [Halomonas sp. ND22Bw]|nr:very short patch repair endonuclease [Halomonas sp. ND22Bw]